MRITEAELRMFIGEPGCCEGDIASLVAEVRRLRALIEPIYDMEIIDAEPGIPWGDIMRALVAEADAIRSESAP